jgi:MinD superfamily P-loop ATPase
MKKQPIVICVTGGKGGTGKTLVSVNLATMFKNEDFKVLLLDGDVENPNTYLLLNGKLENKKEIPFFIPQIIEEKCTKCGICSENCVTHALLYVKDAFPIPILNVCSGCKLCFKICPVKAIQPDSKIIGWSYTSHIRGIDLLVGELRPGEARSAALVEALFEDLNNILLKDGQKYDIVILDTAPGAHCDVELLINKADFIIPVTEPTKFGKLDLLRILELTELLNKDYRVIVNRSSLLGYKEAFLRELKEQNVHILGDIPLDDDIVQSYCKGVPLMDKVGRFSTRGPGYKAFNEIYSNLKNWINNKMHKEVA